jgi:hypothetical protein
MPGFSGHKDSANRLKNKGKAKKSLAFPDETSKSIY